MAEVVYCSAQMSQILVRLYLQFRVIGYAHSPTEVLYFWFIVLFETLLVDAYKWLESASFQFIQIVFVFVVHIS